MRITKNVTIKVALLIIVLVLPLNLLAMISALMAASETTRQAELSLQNIADNAMTTLDHRIAQADLSSHEAHTANKDYATMLLQEQDVMYTNAKYRVWYKFYSEYLNGMGADAYFVTLKYTDDIVLAIDPFYNKMRTSVIERLDESGLESRSNLWTVETINGQRWLFKCADSKGCFYGALISLDRLERELASDIGYNGVSIEFSDNKPNDNSGIGISSKSGRARFYLNISVPASEIKSGILAWQKGAVLMVIVYFGLIPVLYIFLRRWLIKPLEIINQAHHQIEIGNLQYRINEKTDTVEFQKAFDSFNKMADNNYFLRLENAEKELEKKSIELTNLQLQIRPHFLFNTFNLISTLAKNNMYESISSLIQYLSEYFRYLYWTEGKLALFSHELKLIEGYMQAAAIRYPGEFTISYQIDPDTLEARIPPLIIHNFIENIINHALEKGKTTSIVLSALYEEERVIFHISDNGRGMDCETVKDINAHIFMGKDDKVHVGIKNSVKRLDYFFGGEAHIEVDSMVGEGTVFTVIIPHSTKEEGHENPTG